MTPELFMPDWFTRTRDTLTRRPGLGEPEPFERPCVCGESIRGERLAQAREMACPACGRDWFILPRDPYPAPRRRTSPGAVWKRLARTSSASELPTVSDGETTEKARPSVKIAAAPPPPARPPLRDRLSARLASTKQAVRERVRRSARPTRLVILGIGLLLALTAAWLWHSARIDAASATIVAVVPQAEEALAARDFAKAERLFGEAVQAVELLGAADQTALRVRQRHREITALNNLASRTPYDLAAEAEALAAEPRSWSNDFALSHGGRWVILDAELGKPQRGTPMPAASEGDAAEAPARVLRVDLPLVAGEIPVRFEIDARAFKDGATPGRTIFAAQYATWTLHAAPDEPPVWVVRFRPESIFLWTSPDTFAALGFDPDDPAGQARSVLGRQAKRIGLREEPPAGREITK